MRAALPLHLYTEKDWDRQLKQLCDQLGWTLNYHTLRSKGSTSGFPDRLLVRDRLIAAELKTEQGKPSDAQRGWLDGLAQAGVETYLWRPSDLDEIAKVLSKRWKWMPRTHDFERSVLAHAEHTSSGTLTTGYWQPSSLWVAGTGRADTIAQQTLEPPAPPLPARPSYTEKGHA